MMKRFKTLLAAVVCGGLVMQAGLVAAKGNGSGNGNGNNRSSSNRSGNNGGGNSNKSQFSQQSVKVAKINKSTKNLSQQNHGQKNGKKLPTGFVNGKFKDLSKHEKHDKHDKKLPTGFVNGKFKDLNKHDKHDKKKDQATLGPGRPDGRVEVPMSDSGATLLMPTPVTQVKPGSGPQGYVWNNGHWERPKANGTSVSTASAPVNAVVTVNDHRPMKKRGDNVVPPPVAGKNHSSAKVTVSKPKELTGQTVYGSGIGFKELIHIHNPKTIIDALPPWGFTAAEDPRDHRTPNDPRKSRK